MREDPAEVEWIALGLGSPESGDLARAAALWGGGRRAILRADVEAPLNLAYCRLAAGDLDHTRAAYAEALRRAPGSAVAANGLAWTLLGDGGPAEEAVRRAEAGTTASRRHPTSTPLARAYLAGRAVRRRAARDRRALQSEPDNADFQRRNAEIRRCGER
jgi:tetratricopeptide (TPR) repeat protein